MRPCFKDIHCLEHSEGNTDLACEAPASTSSTEEKKTNKQCPLLTFLSELPPSSRRTAGPPGNPSCIPKPRVMAHSCDPNTPRLKQASLSYTERDPSPHSLQHKPGCAPADPPRSPPQRSSQASRVPSDPQVPIGESGPISKGRTTPCIPCGLRSRNGKSAEEVARAAAGRRRMTKFGATCAPCLLWTTRGQRPQAGTTGTGLSNPPIPAKPLTLLQPSCSPPSPHMQAKPRPP